LIPNPTLPRTALAAVLALATLVGLAGCHGATPAAQTPPPPPPAAAELAHGQELFEAGDFSRAADAYETYLAAEPRGEQADLALFRLAMIRLLPDPAVQDWNEARERFEQLVATFPASPWSTQAEVVLHLQREVERLYHQLEGLKRIDLEGAPPPP
jgi:outer membrane protein assembly factor BamD (BamD/ComL family)